MSERDFRCNTCGAKYRGTAAPYKCNTCGGQSFKYMTSAGTLHKKIWEL